MLINFDSNKALESEGFVVLRNVITKLTIKKLYSFYLKNKPSSKLELYTSKNINHVNTAMSPNIAYKRNVLKLIKKELQPLINELFVNYKIVISNYIIKYPGGTNECKIHQDISLIEEDSITSSFTLWFSLEDIDKKSSPLYVIPKTHKILKNYIRGVGVTLGLNNYRDKLLPKAKTVLPFNSGDLLVMNPRLVHGSLSTPNDFNTRIAIGIGIIPNNSKFVLYVKENLFVKKYFINEETMLNYNPEIKFNFKESFELIPEKDINYSKYIDALSNY
jgi:hypothetical protein